MNQERSTMNTNVCDDDDEVSKIPYLVCNRSVCDYDNDLIPYLVCNRSVCDNDLRKLKQWAKFLKKYEYLRNYMSEDKNMSI